MIEPILLGGGKRIFPDDGPARPLQLVSATTAATGVQVCTYRPAAPLNDRPTGTSPATPAGDGDREPSRSSRQLSQ